MIILFLKKNSNIQMFFTKKLNPISLIYKAVFQKVFVKSLKEIVPIINKKFKNNQKLI